MKKFTLVGVLSASMVLTGCDEDFVRVLDDVYDCTHVDVAGVEYDVMASPFDHGIGYFDSGFVTHSECTPSSIISSNGSTTYAFYEYGNPVNGEGNIHSLRFWYAPGGKEMLDARRVYDESKGEMVTREDGTLGNIQLVEWTSAFGTIVAENKFNTSTAQKVTVTYGNMSKERTYNANTAEWDCVWKDSGSVLAIDATCTNEAVLDVTHLGLVALGEPYFEILNESRRTYETSEEDIQRDINDYYEYY